MKKFSALFLVIFLAGCAAAPAVQTLVPETSTMEIKPTATVQPPQDAFVPTAAEILPAAAPATVQPTPMSLPRLEPGSPVMLDSLHMIDADTGWGIEKSGHILRTRDGGQTWQDVTPPQGAYGERGFFALDAAAAWAVQDSTGANILRTTDGGQTWEAVQNPAAASESMDLYLGVYFVDAQTGWYFGERSGHGIAHPTLASTVDGGKTWIRNDSFGAYSFYTDMLVVNKDVLFLSGGIWGDVRDNCSDSAADYINGKVGPDLEKTTDGGKTWSTVSLPHLNPIPNELKLLALPGNQMACRVDSVNFAHVYSQRIVATVSCQVGTERGTQWFYGVSHYFTDDGEKWYTWQPASEDEAANDFINSQIGWRQINAGNNQSCHLQKTVDGGQSWGTVKTTGWCASQLDFVDEQVGWAIARSGDVTALVHTSDGGKTWEELKPRVATPLTGLMDVDMVSENIGWALTQKSENTNALFYTTDGGLAWTDITPPDLANSSIRAIFLDEQTAWAEKCNPETGKCNLLRTLNGGKTWTVQNEDLPFSFYSTSITFLNNRDGLAQIYDVGAGQGVTTLFQTQDGGSTWKQLMLKNPQGTIGREPGGIDTCNICGDVFYYSPNRMIVIDGDLASDPGGAVHLSISTDLGNTWKSVRLPLPDDKKYADGLVAPLQPIFFNDRDGVLPFQIVDQTFTQRVTAIYRTQDGGQTWQSNSKVFENIASLVFLSPQDAFAICGEALCVTHDRAQTWQALSTNLNFRYSDSGEYVARFYFLTPLLGWALTVYNDSRTLWKTIDGGQIWTEIKPVVANP